MKIGCHRATPAAEMALLSSSSVLPHPTLSILRLRYPPGSSFHYSSNSNRFLHSPPPPTHRAALHAATPRPLGPRFLAQEHRNDQYDDEDEGAHLSGTLEEEEEEEEGEEEGEWIQESEEELREWDPPVSPFRRQVRVHHHHQEQEEEQDEDGGWWSDPGFFLRGQEEELSSSVGTTTTAMEEILVFARSAAPLDEFLAGYNRGALGVEECAELVRRMGEEGLALGCLHLLRWVRAQEEPMPVPPQAWLVTVVALGRAGLADEVLEIVGSLPPPPERGFRDAAIYNAAMLGVASCGRFDDAWEIVKLMEEDNVQPDHMTSLIMLKVMIKSKASPKDAWNFFERMNRKGVNWSLDVSASLVKIFCDEGLKKEALIIQSEMENRGIASNTSIYNTLMSAYCKSTQIEEAEGLFAEMKAKGLKATTVTYNILMGAYSRRLQPEVVESLLLEMQDLGLQPNAGSYNCLISAYGQQKKMSEKAKDAFLRMKMDGIHPTSSTYTSLVCAYVFNGLHEKAYLTYVDMKREGLKPSLEAYTALIDTFRSAGDTEKLIETLKSMISEKVPVTRVVFHMVLDGLAKHGLFVQARDVIYEFGRIGLQPTVMTYNILVNAYARGGQHYKLPQLLKEMVTLELKPDSITYSTMIYAYARVRDFKRAYYYHKQMVRSGQVPDARSYKKLLNTLDVKSARKDIKNKSAIVGIIRNKSGLKHRKEKKDEFWKNGKKRSMMNKVYGHPRKRFL